MRKNGTLEDAFFSAFEGIPKGLSKGTPKVVPWDLYKVVQESAFEVEIKGAFEMTVEMLMLVHLIVRKSVWNDSIKRWTSGALYVTLETTIKISL